MRLWPGKRRAVAALSGRAGLPYRDPGHIWEDALADTQLPAVPMPQDFPSRTRCMAGCT